MSVPQPVDIFHLGPVLSYIADGIDSAVRDRDIIITNQNSQQQQLTSIDDNLGAAVSAISSSSAQLSSNISAINTELSTKIDSNTDAVSAIGPSIAAPIATLNTNIENLITLIEAMIQGLQGVATLAAQNQELTLLGQLSQVTSPEKAVSLRLDTSSGVAVPQPIPAKRGP